MWNIELRFGSQASRAMLQGRTAQVTLEPKNAVRSQPFNNFSGQNEELIVSDGMNHQIIIRLSLNHF